MNSPASDIEASLLKIPGVRAAKLVTDERGNPIEVHVVATGDKAPKQLVRDIQTVSLANFGIDLDHRIVSVVQFPDIADQLAEKQARPTLKSVSTEIAGQSASVIVTLVTSDGEFQGKTSGPNSRESLVRTAAAATVGALRELALGERWLELAHAGVQGAGGNEIAVITLQMGSSGKTETLSGSAVVAGLTTDAAARAVLDAVNRRLWGRR